MTLPAREIELKFLLDRADIGTILAALPPGETRVKDMVAVYYDTADDWLRRHGYGLRVRRTGETCIQTLKSALGDDGGRDEWEWPVPDDAVDLALLANTPAALPKDLTLEPKFTVTVNNNHATDSAFASFNNVSPVFTAPANSGANVTPEILGGRLISINRGTSLPGVEALRFRLRENATITVQ